MQWIVDGIHDSTLTDHQKNPPKELIISWITSALSDISEEMVELSFLSVSRTQFFMLVLRNHFCFLLLLLLFFFKVQSKIGLCIIYGRVLYTVKCGNLTLT